MYSEDRRTNKKLLDKVLDVIFEHHRNARQSATEKIHDKLRNIYDTKTRRYKGFEWVVSSIDLKK